MEKLHLRDCISSKEKKQHYVTWLFETIAPRYDFITRFLSYGMDRRWKRRLVELAELRGSELVLDIACGTGDITFAVAERLNTGYVVGLDIAERMLAAAERKRQAGAITNITFERGDILRLPFANAQFDRVTAGYALRNVPDIEAALSEIKRVLRPGGRFLSLDFGLPSNPVYRTAYLVYLTVVGAALGLVLHGDPDTYRYIPETLKLYPGQAGVRAIMDRLGFVATGFHDFGGGIMAINYGGRAL